MPVNRTYLRKDVIKKRRKRALLRAFWLGILLLTIIGSGIFSLHQPPLKIVSYNIKGVVEGNEKAINQILEEYINGGNNYLIPLNTVITFPTRRIQNLIKEDHLIASVNVSRKMSYPFEITVDVTEKKIAHVLCIEENRIGEPVACSWYGLDDGGYAIKKIPNPYTQQLVQLKNTLQALEVAATSTASSTTPVLTPLDVPTTTGPYIRVSKGVLNTGETVLGKEIIPGDVIHTILKYSEMLLKNNYLATRFQVFDAKTYIYIKDNGYVIIPVGVSTKPEFEINQNDIDDKVMYLESVITDANIAKNLYAASTTSTINKNSKSTTASPTAKKPADLLRFEYIDARLAKKIFIDPKSKDSAATSTKSN